MDFLIDRRSFVATQMNEKRGEGQKSRVNRANLLRERIRDSNRFALSRRSRRATFAWFGFVFKNFQRKNVRFARDQRARVVISCAARLKIPRKADVNLDRSTYIDRVEVRTMIWTLISNSFIHPSPTDLAVLARVGVRQLSHARTHIESIDFLALLSVWRIMEDSRRNANRKIATSTSERTIPRTENLDHSRHAPALRGSDAFRVFTSSGNGSGA